MRNKLSAVLTMLAVLLVPAFASAHVTVKPAEVGVGEYQTFTTNVPNEKNMPTVGVRLVIPAGLNYVQPTVKQGWTIDEKTTGGGDFPTVTEISWTGGSVPTGQREEFSFAAQAPAKPTSIDWKAYQTYEDGTVVSWDQKPDGKDSEDSTPYSVTKVVNDLTPASTASSSSDSKASANTALPTIIAIIALVVAFGAYLRPTKK